MNPTWRAPQPGRHTKPQVCSGVGSEDSGGAVRHRPAHRSTPLPPGGTAYSSLILADCRALVVTGRRRRR